MTTKNTYQPQERSWMIYPQGGWRKVMFKAPLYLWRLGLGALMPKQMLVLTALGRKSGEPRPTMLEYTYANGNFYLSSGWGDRAQWYKNALVNPLVTVQTVLHGTVSGRATQVTEDEEFAVLYEHARLSPVWEDYLSMWGIEDTVEDFVAKKDRLHVLRIEPVDAETPPPLPVDLWWVWPIIGLEVLAMIWFFGRKK